jgi:3-deoxy-D-manno-octulosonic-acid transferase
MIVPHEIDEREKAQAKKLLGEKVCFYSEKEKLNEKTKLLWMDHVGMLAQLYRYADVVYIGGGFDRGGIHSMIEPLVYGCPVCFGPENRSYKEVKDLITAGGAAVIHNSEELSAFVLKYKRDQELLSETKAANKKYLLNSGGASLNILNYLSINGYI